MRVSKNGFPVPGDTSEVLTADAFSYEKDEVNGNFQNLFGALFCFRGGSLYSMGDLATLLGTRPAQALLSDHGHQLCALVATGSGDRAALPMGTLW